MMKLGGRCVVQKSRRKSNLGVIDRLGAHPPKCGVGLQRWEISTGCLGNCSAVLFALLGYFYGLLMMVIIIIIILLQDEWNEVYINNVKFTVLMPCGR